VYYAYSDFKLLGVAVKLNRGSSILGKETFTYHICLVVNFFHVRISAEVLGHGKRPHW